MAMVPMGWPVVGEMSVAGVLPGVSTWGLPATVKPVTNAIVPAGTLALSSTLPLDMAFIGTVMELGASVRSD